MPLTDNHTDFLIQEIIERLCGPLGRVLPEELQDLQRRTSQTTDTARVYASLSEGRSALQGGDAVDPSSVRVRSPERDTTPFPHP